MFYKLYNYSYRARSKNSRYNKSPLLWVTKENAKYSGFFPAGGFVFSLLFNRDQFPHFWINRERKKKYSIFLYYEGIGGRGAMLM